LRAPDGTGRSDGIVGHAPNREQETLSYPMDHICMRPSKTVLPIAKIGRGRSTYRLRRMSAIVTGVHHLAVSPFGSTQKTISAMAPDSIAFTLVVTVHGMETRHADRSASEPAM
jgi:hypothetical protein